MRCPISVTYIVFIQFRDLPEQELYILKYSLLKYLLPILASDLFFIFTSKYKNSSKEHLQEAGR